MPASRARWMTRMESASSLLPHGPNIMAPRHSGLTETPVRPRIRFCMAMSVSFAGCGRDLIDSGEGVEGAWVADERQQIGDDADQQLPVVADVEVGGRVSPHLGVAPAELHHEP